MARRGGKRRPFYHIVAADKRKPRDGRYLEHIGSYDPRGDTQLAVDEEKAKKWLNTGAQPSPTVKKLFKRAGIN
jgi:small subunit ribosomal protein S16